MTTALCPHRTASPASGVKIFGFALVSGMAPGFLIGLSLMQPFSLANLAEHFNLPFLTALMGALIGAPFSLLVFAPFVSHLSRHWRLSWPHMTAIGFLSAFLGIVFGDLDGAVALALCGAVAGFSFWLMVGDIDARSGSSDEGQSQ